MTTNDKTTFSETGRALYMLEAFCAGATNFGEQFHRLAKAAGWYNDPKTGEPLTRNRGEMLALIHSEISEALEGERKNKMDDHLPHRKAAEVELADALIRIFDYAGYCGYDVIGAAVEKCAYNAKREDHKPENRAKAGGKAF